MGDAEFLNHQSPRVIPRRTGLFLTVINNFPYIMALPLVAVLLWLNPGLLPTVILSFAAFCLIWLFWNSFVLDLPLAEDHHPHHLQWGRLSRLLGRSAAVLQGFKPWTLALIFWFAATLINLAGIIMEGERYLLMPFWLLYVPVVIWPGYKMENKASEWFGVLWAASALVYLAAFVWVTPLGNGWPVAAALLSNLVWFLFISVFIYYLFRRLTIFRCQSEFLQEIIRELRQERGYSEAFDTRPITSEPDEHLNRIARMIGSKLKFERVYLHIRDAEKERLFMKGRYCANRTPWPAEGWSVRDNPSITGWVVQNKQAHLCSDTRRCSLYFKDDPETACQSEAAVPIIVENEVVGLIDVESDHRRAFDSSDVQLLWQVADSIGAALAYERHISSEVEKAYRLMEESAQKMVYTRSLDDALDQIAEQARSLFGADLVTIYKHAVSTCVPLPGLIHKGDVRYPQLLGQGLPYNARVNELLLQKDEIYVQPLADEDDLLLGPNQGVYTPEEAELLGHPHRFVKREGIKSAVYIKLGLGQEVVGSLFLNYRSRTTFQKSQINALRAFAKTLALALILKRQVERANGPLAGAIPLAHSQAEAAFEYASREFHEINLAELDSFPGCQGIQRQLSEFSKKLELVKLQWNNLILVEQSHLRGSSLAEPITHLETKLRTMFPGVRMKWNSQEFLSIPLDELGEVLYKIISESVSNALVHARASLIELKATREDELITLSVYNNGTAIDPGRAMWINSLISSPYDPDSLEKSTGIASILLDARRWFGADWSFTLGETVGTLITVRFPIGRMFDRYREEEEDGNKTEI